MSGRSRQGPLGISLMIHELAAVRNASPTAVRSSSVHWAHFSRVSTATDTKGQRSVRIEGETFRGSRNQSVRI
jgi:hypothetical protein